MTMKLITLGTSHGDPTLERFNSALVLEVNSALYLFEAGAPVNALMIRHGLQFANLKAAFVSHSHEDHIGGITGLIKSVVKRPEPGQFTRIFLPEKPVIEAVECFLAATHRPYPKDLMSLELIGSGRVYGDENITVDAIPTRHFSNEGKDFPSYAFLVTSGHKRVVFTGDISRKLDDLPLDALATPAVCVMECQHYDPAEAGKQLNHLPIERFIGVHVSDKWHKLGDAAFTERLGNPPFPVVLAKDGMEFEL